MQRLPGLQRARHQGALEADRQRGFGTLGQRRGQAQRHALQAAGQQHFGHAAPEKNRSRVRRAAAGVRCQARHQPQLFGLAQPFCRQAALRLEGHAGLAKRRSGCRTRAAVNANVAPQQTGLCADHGKPFVRDVHRAFEPGHQWRLRSKPHIIAGQRHCAFDRRFVDVIDGKAQAKTVVGHAARRGLRQRLLRHIAERRRVDKTQRIRQRALDVRRHFHGRVVHQVGNAGVALDQLQPRQAGNFAARALHLQRGPVKNQFSIELRQRRPRGCARRLQRLGDIDKLAVAHLGRHLKVPLRRVGKRQVIDRALDLELHVADLALHHGIAHIVAHVSPQHQRQIAMHPTAIAPAQAALQIKNSGETAVSRIPGGGRATDAVIGLPAHLRLPLGVGIRKLHIPQLHFDFLARDLPFRFGRELVEQKFGVFKDTRQVQRSLGDFHAGLTAFLRDIEVHRGTAHPRTARNSLDGSSSGSGSAPAWGRNGCRQRGNTQARHPAFGCIGRGRVQRPLPSGIERFYQPLRRKRGQHRLHPAVQRQAAGNLGQRRQVQPVGLERGGFAGAACLVGVNQRQVAARPLQAVPGAKLQAFGAEIKPLRMLAGPQTPGQQFKPQRLQLRAQPHVHIPQRHIGQCAGDLSLADVEPGAQCALAPVQCNVQRSQARIVLETRHIDPRKIPVHLPGPGHDIAGAPGQQRLPENSPETEAISPFRRRRRIQPHPVAVPAIAHDRIDLAQGQRRCLAHLVGPAYGAAAYDELHLREKPVRHGAVAGIAVFGHFEPADKDFSVSGAPDIQLGPLDHQLLEAQPPQRSRRQRTHHARQADRFAPLAVEQRDVIQLERGHRAQRTAGDLADANRYP